jgi:hypothetical protein
MFFSQGFHTAGATRFLRFATLAQRRDSLWAMFSSIGRKPLMKKPYQTARRAFPVERLFRETRDGILNLGSV